VGLKPGSDVVSPTAGADIEMETGGKVALRGGEDEGGVVVLIAGKGWRPLVKLPGEEGDGGDTPLALLSLRFRYCAILS